MARQVISEIENLRFSGNRWNNAFLGLLAALLAFMPLAFGAVEAWSELITVLVAAMLSLFLVSRILFEPQFRFVFTWIYIPLGLFLLLAAFQLTPLPTGWIDVISPSIAQTKNGLLQGATTSLNHMSLSFYPRETARMLQMVLVGSAVFVVVVNTFRNTRRIKQLLAIVFIIGCAEATIALAQIATLAKQIYWSVGSANGGVVTAGSFVNYSNFSQFMNLSLGAGVALLLVRLHEGRRKRFNDSTASFSAQIQWEEHSWLLAGIVLCGLAVLTSLSRNGAISMLVASVIVGTALYRRGSLSWKGWLLVILPLGMLGGVFIAGFDSIYERFATLQNRQPFEGRWEMTTATLRAWQEFPLWGSGLGTHEFVFPMFDEGLSKSVAEHADNDYAQLLEETGLIGAVLVGAFLSGIGVLCVKLMLAGRTPLSSAAFGLGFGLLAVGIHSASDFGQHLPAVFCLSAVTCSLLVAISRIERRSQIQLTDQQQNLPGKSERSIFNQSSSRWLRRLVALASLAGLVVVWGWALKSAYARYQGEQWWAVAIGEETRLNEVKWQGDDQQYVDLIAATERASLSEPSNAKYGYWLNLYRWQSLSRAVDSDTGEILLHPDVIPYVKQITDELAQLRTLCPTFGPTFAFEGQLRLFVLKEEAGAKLIRQGYTLAPHDPSTCLVAGKLAASEGLVEEAVERLRRAEQLNPGYYRAVVDIFLFDMERPDLARSLAGDGYRRLRQLAALCAGDERFASLSGDLLAEAESNLRSRTTSDDATADELGEQANIDYRKGDYESAIALYRRSLTLDYSQVGRRLNLARALAELGKTKEAIHEARICLRIKPGLKAARDLIGRLSLLDVD